MRFFLAGGALISIAAVSYVLIDRMGAEAPSGSTHVPETFVEKKDCAGTWHYALPAKGLKWVATVDGADAEFKSYFEVSETSGNAFEMRISYKLGPISEEARPMPGFGRIYDVQLGLYNNAYTRMENPRELEKVTVSYQPEVPADFSLPLAEGKTFSKKVSVAAVGGEPQLYDTELYLEYAGCGTLDIQGQRHDVSIIDVQDMAVEGGDKIPVARRYFMSDKLGIPLAEVVPSYNISAIHIF